MYYSGYFRNKDTSIDEAGQLFKVVIITNFRKNEYDYGGELILSDTPFTVTYESEDGNIYKPYKCSYMLLLNCSNSLECQWMKYKCSANLSSYKENIEVCSMRLDILIQIHHSNLQKTVNKC